METAALTEKYNFSHKYYFEKIWIWINKIRLQHVYFHLNQSSKYGLETNFRAQVFE